MDTNPEAMGWGDLRDKTLKKQFKAEKNLWMSLFAFTLYVTIHRYRHDVKAGLQAKSAATTKTAATAKKAA